MNEFSILFHTSELVSVKLQTTPGNASGEQAGECRLSNSRIVGPAATTAHSGAYYNRHDINCKIPWYCAVVRVCSEADNTAMFVDARSSRRTS
jgi:hypothetical protein